MLRPKASQMLSNISATDVAHGAVQKLACMPEPFQSPLMGLGWYSM